MLQVLLTYDGNSLLIFKQEDILNIRMTTLYSWLTDSDFNINLKDVLGVEPGSKLFCLFSFWFLIFVEFFQIKCI